jgi:hypothetical protein
MKGNFDTEDVQATQELLEKYETLQYAFTGGGLPEDLIQEARSVLNQLESKS